MVKLNSLSHRTKAWDIEVFYRQMHGLKQIRTEEEKNNFEAWYFAMCLLLPRESFLQKVELLGGIDVVISDSHKKQLLASFFKVEPALVVARILDILSRQEKENGEKAQKIYK